VLLLAVLQILVALNLLLRLELFAQTVCLRVLALLDKALEDLLVLQQGRRRLESVSAVQVLVKFVAKLHQLLHVRLIKSFQVSLAALNQLLLVFIPVALEVSQVFVLLLQELVHLDVVLGQDLAAALAVLLVAQFFNLRLRLLGVCRRAA